MLIIDRNTSLVDATGATRRLRALVATGHSTATIARQLGVLPAALDPLLSGERVHVSLATHAKVSAFFRTLWDRPVTGPAGDPAREYARTRGWVGPLAWDDLDDPHEKPNVRGPRRRKGEPRPIDETAIDRVLQGEAMRLSRAERQIVVPRLHALRWSDERMAAHLRVSAQTIFRDRRELDLPSFDQREIQGRKSA